MATGSAAYDGFFNNENFGAGFDQRFSFPGLTAAMTVGGLAGMCGTAMFGWAAIPNAIKNLATAPGIVTRVNSGAWGNVAHQAAQGAAKQSSNP